MRIKNKEIRRRRHRKEQVIKAAARETRLTYANKPAGEKAAAPKVAKAPAKKAEAAPKPKKAAPKKKAEQPAAEA